MSIAGKMNYLKETKNQIKEAIKGKGIDVLDTDTFRSYATKISKIQNDASIKDCITTYLPTGDYLIRRAFKTLPSDFLPEIFSRINNFNFGNAFYDCSNLEELDFTNCDLSKVYGFSSMFYLCKSLKKIKGVFDMVKSTNSLLATFYECNELEEVYIKNLHQPLRIDWSIKLKKECLVYLLENAQTVPSTTNINIGSTNLAKLTAEEIAVGTNKGYTIS